MNIYFNTPVYLLSTCPRAAQWNLTLERGYDKITLRTQSEGGDSTTDEMSSELPLMQQVVIALAELGWNAGIMGAAVMQHMPDEIQANWEERLEYLRDWSYAQTIEIQAFAEAFDH